MSDATMHDALPHRDHRMCRRCREQGKRDCDIEQRGGQPPCNNCERSLQPRDPRHWYCVVDAETGSVDRVGDGRARMMAAPPSQPQQQHQQHQRLMPEAHDPPAGRSRGMPPFSQEQRQQMGLELGGYDEPALRNRGREMPLAPSQQQQQRHRDSPVGRFRQTPPPPPPRQQQQHYDPPAGRGRGMQPPPSQQQQHYDPPAGRGRGIPPPVIRQQQQQHVASVGPRRGILPPSQPARDRGGARGMRDHARGHGYQAPALYGAGGQGYREWDRGAYARHVHGGREYIQQARQGERPRGGHHNVPAARVQARRLEETRTQGRRRRRRNVAARQAAAATAADATQGVDGATHGDAGAARVEADATQDEDDASQPDTEMYYDAEEEMDLSDHPQGEGGAGGGGLGP